MGHAQAVDGFRSPREGAEPVIVRALLTLLFVVAATGVSVGLSIGLGLDRLQILFLLPVVAAAVRFGLWYGFTAAVACVVAYSYFINPPVGSWRLGSPQDILNLVVFVGGGWIAGLYTDTIKRRQSAARTLMHAGRGLTAHADGPALGQFYQSVAEQGEIGSRRPVLPEFARAAASVGLVLAAAAAAFAAQAPLGASASTLLLLGSVIATAVIFGARFAYLAAVLATLAHELLIGGAPWALHLGFAPDLVHLALFAGVGGWVGALSDRARHERQAVQTLFTTGRNLSAVAEEAPLRAILFDAFTRATGGGSVQLADETGKIHHERIARGRPPVIDAAQLDPNETLQMGPWRLRRMVVDGRDVGVVSWRLSPLSAEDHAAADQIVAAISDLGASAIMRARLSAEKAEMEFIARTEQLRTILLDAVSHHFRTPLSSILGSVTSLLDQPDQHDERARRDFLLIIKEQANRLNRYVENFLGVARLESGSIQIRPEPVDLEPLLYDVWESFGEAGGARRFLDARLVDEQVLADPLALKQVFGNLLENAIKFSGEESVVSVRSQVQQDCLVLQVADEGCGVPPADLQRIFDRFYRSRGAKAPGLGLGLYITRSLVELMGGAIEAGARTDGRAGLVISISLPLAKARA